MGTGAGTPPPPNSRILTLLLLTWNARWFVPRRPSEESSLDGHQKARLVKKPNKVRQRQRQPIGRSVWNLSQSDP